MVRVFQSPWMPALLDLRAGRRAEGNLALGGMRLNCVVDVQDIRSKSGQLNPKGGAYGS